MKILGVTCYTGGVEYTSMTEGCLASLRECAPWGVRLWLSVTAQGWATLPRCHVDTLVPHPKNVGFAWGMNRAIEGALDSVGEDPDYVLCFNNDLEFPHKDWLVKLLEIAGLAPPQVLVPATNDAGTSHVVNGPSNQASFRVRYCPAYCWLIPFEWCRFLKDTYGFWLFDEDFSPAYGEDEWTAFLLSKKFGSGVFRYVPRAFVRHLRAQTAGAVPHDRTQTNRVLIDKLEGELKDPKLLKIRPDLCRWARQTLRTLRRRNPS